MNLTLLFAGFLALIAAFAHGLGGEKTDIFHLWQSDLIITEKLELRGSWHFISATFFLTAGVMFYLAWQPMTPAGAILTPALAVLYATYGLVWFVIVAWNNWRLLGRLPQWVLMLAISALLYWP